MYVTAGNRVLAIDSENGKEIWRYQAKHLRINVGVAYWPGDADLAPQF
jgi:glucose dehydrogenase